MPEISVVIPVYNVEKYLHKCVDSVLSQTFADWEIILVDDGSKDGCPAICDEYAQKYPGAVTVIHQKNAGLSGARNRGIEQSRGRYILFVDSDDSIQPNMAERLYEVARSMKFPDMVICDAYKVSESGKIIDTHKNDIPALSVIDAFDHRGLLLAHNASWCRIVKKEIYVNNNLLFPVGRWFEDLCMTPKLMLACKTIVYLDVPLYNYLIRQGSIMNSVNPEKVADMLPVLEEMIAYYREKDAFDHFKNELEYLAINHLAYRASIRVMRASPGHPMMEQSHSFMRRYFPDYLDNKYIRKWPKMDRLILFLLHDRRYRIIALMLRIKDSIKKFGGNSNL